MQIILNILAFLLTIFVLIVTHECGHLFVAKLCNVKVIKFSIGFGKELFSWHGRRNCDGYRTKYVLALLPFGGYVKMLDSREMTVPAAEKHLAFDHKPVLSRILIALAGPVTNLLLALVVFWVMYVVGITVNKPIIGKVVPQSIAGRVGVQTGDEIISIDRKATEDWQGVMFGIFAHVGDRDDLLLQVKNQATAATREYNLNLANWNFSGMESDPLQELGIVPYHPLLPPVIGLVKKDTPAAHAGLLRGDRVLNVDGKAIADWDELLDMIRVKPAQVLHMTILRDNQQLHFNVLTDWKFGANWQKIGYLGVAASKVAWPQEMLLERNYSLLGAIVPAWREVSDFMLFNGMVLGKLVTGKLSLGILGGPIAIFQSSASAMNQGLVVFVGFLGIFSVMLAFVNLLPIPGLDGGHVLLSLIEGIRRKPFSIAVQVLLVRLGMIALILLAVRASINDLLRIFQ